MLYRVALSHIYYIYTNLSIAGRHLILQVKSLIIRQLNVVQGMEEKTAIVSQNVIVNYLSYLLS